MPFSHNNLSSQTKQYRSTKQQAVASHSNPHISTRSHEHHGYSPQHKEHRYSNPSQHTLTSHDNTRDVSPPRTQAEQPRQDTRLYSDHRSVSPPGSLAQDAFTDLSSGRLSSPSRTHSFSKPHYNDSLYNHGNARKFTSGLRRRGAIRGNAASRPKYSKRGRKHNMSTSTINTGKYHADSISFPKPQANIRGDFSTWEYY